MAAEFLSDRRKYKIGIGRRQVLQFLKAVPQTEAPGTSVGKGDQALYGLETGIEGIEPWIQKSSNPTEMGIKKLTNPAEAIDHYAAAVDRKSVV